MFSFLFIVLIYAINVVHIVISISSYKIILIASVKLADEISCGSELWLFALTNRTLNGLDTGIILLLRR